MRVRGTRTFVESVDVDPIQVLDRLKFEFGLTGEELHLYENKLYELEDVGTHHSDYRRKLFSDKERDIKIFNAIEYLKSELENPPNK